MCVTQFAEMCRKGKFYRFKTLEDFDKGIDYDGVNQKKKGVRFERGVIDEYERGGYDIMTNAVPTRWSAYGVSN